MMSMAMLVQTCHDKPQPQEKAVQGTFKADIEIQKTSPTLTLNGAGAVINFNNDMDFTLSSNLLSINGGNVSVGANSILGTGSIGGTGTGKFTKGWFTNLEVTNLPTINGVGIFVNPVITGTLTTPALTLGSTLLTATGTEINKLHGLNVSTAELNYSLGLRSNIQQALDGKISNYNAAFTGITSVEALQIGTSSDKITIQGVTDVGQGYTFTKDGAELAPKIPEENQVNINDIPTVPTIHYAAGDTSNYPIPGKIGNIFINTTAGKVYISKAVTRGGWVILN